MARAFRPAFVLNQPLQVPTSGEPEFLRAASLFSSQSPWIRYRHQVLDFDLQFAGRMSSGSQINDCFWKPPPLKQEEYDWWVAQFTSHTCSLNGQLWKVIALGDEKIVDVAGKDKEISLYSDVDWKALELNNRAKKLLHMALGPSDLRKVLRYNTAHEIWEAFKRTYGGNEDVKKNRILSAQKDYDSAS